MDDDELDAAHLKALELFDQGLGYEDVAVILGVPRDVVKGWMFDD